MQISAIVQARMSSTRLPGKVMQNIAGKPILQHVLERLGKSWLINEIVVAIAREKNSPLPVLARRCGVKSFIGGIEDVLDRYYQAAKKYKTDIIVRITSDCPLIDPEVVDRVLSLYLQAQADYTTNTLKRTFPTGLDAEVFPFKVLEQTWKEARQPHEREHVTPYIREHPNNFSLINLENDKDLSYMRWTVDEEKDLKFVREIYKRLYRNGRIFLMEDILALLEREPQLLEINRDVKQKSLKGWHHGQDKAGR